MRPAVMAEMERRRTLVAEIENGGHCRISGVGFGEAAPAESTGCMSPSTFTSNDLSPNRHERLDFSAAMGRGFVRRLYATTWNGSAWRSSGDDRLGDDRRDDAKRRPVPLILYAIGAIGAGTVAAIVLTSKVIVTSMLLIGSVAIGFFAAVGVVLIWALTSAEEARPGGGVAVRVVRDFVIRGAAFSILIFLISLIVRAVR